MKKMNLILEGLKGGRVSEEKTKKAPKKGYIGTDLFDFDIDEEAQPVTKTWSKEDVKDLLTKNDFAVKRAIIALYSLQTEAEKRRHSTEDKNKKGFNSLDADFLSSLAEQLVKNGSLSVKQIASGRKAVLKYSGQLSRIANGELEVKLVKDLQRAYNKK